jgi:glycosyltransferase involved in cell wall biosynthesis
MADLYVFPSRHESYGLTLLEALAAGLPAVCVDHLGARAVMKDDFGMLVKPAELAVSITALLGDRARRARMSTAAQEFARTERFSNRAAELAKLLQ